MPAHIVDFEKYCKTCQYLKTEEFEDPCHRCLEEPVNEDSRKPVEYKEASKPASQKKHTL